MKHGPIHFALAAAALLAMACGGPADSSADEQAIRQVVAEQEGAWDRGDVRGFMQGYADDICFFSKRGPTCGKEAVTERYLKAYPDAAAMGDLTFTLFDVRAAGRDHAWVAGAWQLARIQDTLSGGFSLLWEKRGGRWLIIRDHSY